MKKLGTAACAGVVVLIAAASGARAWEAETTHAGLAERSAQGSSLHDRLAERFDLELGLYAPLTIDPSDAPALFEALAALNPSHGYAPDAAGELDALGWLVAGAVLADMPAEHAVHHAYDPLTQQGFSSATLRGGLGALGHRLRARAAGARLLRSGMPATEWLTHADNPFGLAGFLDQYAHAVSARTPDERGRHAAGMLLAAGAIIHVVQDSASPARARDDRAAMLRQIGPDRIDAGSRFERLASLSFGRLGVPAPARAPSLRPALADYISADDGSGLADIASRRFMSYATVPRPIEVTPTMPPEVLERRLRDSLRRPAPAPAPALDLRAAASEGGARLLDQDGVCIAHYQLRSRELSWGIPDACALEQAAVLLREASATGAGVIDWLLRGDLEVRAQGGAISIAANGVGVREANVTLLWEDARGVRTAFGALEDARGDAGEVIARIRLPDEREARRVVVLVRGLDEHGEKIATSGAIEL